MNLVEKLFNRRIDVRSWGTERATLELLGEEDRKWVTLRYKIALDYIDESSLVLDAASGSGFGTELLAQKVCKVLGIDASAEAVRYSKKHHKPGNCAFRVMDVTHMEIEDNCFDASVGIETLEHIEDPYSYLKELKRVTRNSGRVIVSTPLKKTEVPQTPFHIQEFSYEEFIEMMAQHFNIIKIIGLKRKPEISVAEMNSGNFSDFDIMLAICENCKGESL